MCVVLSILFILLYKATNEHWILKGMTAVIFSSGLLLGIGATLMIMKTEFSFFQYLVIAIFLVVDFFCFPFYINISVFLHKIVLVSASVIASYKFFKTRRTSFLSKLLLGINSICALIQWGFAVVFYIKGPTHFFWDNAAYIVQNFIISMIFVCITIQDAKAYYAKTVNELQDEIVLGQRQLQESYEKNQLKSNVFADLSHELKTPINVICSNIQLFEKCLADEPKGLIESDKYLKSMERNCYRLIKLVNNIIDTNKIELGYMKIEVKNYNIIPFIEEMVMSINAYALQKEITLTFDTEVEELVMACDIDKIEKIMFNLLSNAIKYTPIGGEILVDISHHVGNIYVTLQDTGEGIPEVLHESIFNRFTQNKGEYHEKYNSSGIGLALVKSLVELQQGSIWIDKEYKDGCKIIFTLPINILEGVDTVLYKNMDYNEYYIEFV